MNRKEASFILANIDRRVCDDELNEALDVAIKALDQEPCDNAVSRRDVLDLAKKGILISNGNYESVCKAINELPPVNPQSCEDAISRQYLIDIATKDGAYDYVSAQEIANAPHVTPQPKTGHWIDDNENEIGAQYGIHLYKCSECDEYANAFVGGTEDWWDLEKPNYCPNCGARMVEPQESEDKE